MSSAAPKNPFQLEEGAQLTPAMYEKFRSRIYDLTGVHLPLNDKNMALMLNRLSRMLRKLHLSSYEEYWEILSRGGASVQSEFISALTTNMTSFFREASHFDFLKKTLPSFVSKEYEVRIWCSASSTGQEPYSIAMTAAELYQGLDLRKIRILATDVDLNVLEKASNGVYVESECQGLSLELRSKYLEKSEKGKVPHFLVKENVHQLVRFAPFNLVNSPMDFQKKFHYIFCRNVLIYFDAETVKKVIHRLTEALIPGGYLVIGHSESGNISHHDLTVVQQAVFRKKMGAL